MTQIASKTSLPEGFMYIRDIHPDIRLSNRYHSHDNFMGRPFPFYANNVLIISNEAAESLRKIQDIVAKDGLDLVFYDGYRPQSTVNAFVTWANDPTEQSMKSAYYARVNKADAFELGYIARRSGHTRGSTVDLTLIEKGKYIIPTQKIPRTLEDGFEFMYLDDNTVDTFTHVDLFDDASHHGTALIPEAFQKWRNYLRDVMVANGFKPYSKEWWHYSLENEPYPDTYFDFPVRDYTQN
ncbi:MAG: M15 family metallopeptidase [Alphaproteobacteria bacterium]|nr:M15 family metallopeptidase [Alphaproteobacteria bacterium]